MKIKTSTFLGLLVIVAGLAATMPSAFAAEVSVPAGTSVPGCEETNECWSPAEISVGVGETVTWSNDDTAAHTVTSGSAADGPDGVFDSSLFMAGAEWSHTFDTAGEYPYFCMVHPWMAGVVIVGAMAEDVELMVTITESAMGDGTHVYLEFSEIHVNYEMIGMQNDEKIFTIPGHAMEMTTDHHIDAVGTPESPLDIEIVSLGIGPEGANQDWTGPTGTIDTIQIVPESGTIAMMVLAIAIISIVAVTAKSRVIPRF